jgi:hypothetical protein
MENQESLDKGIIFYECDGRLSDGTLCTMKYPFYNVPPYCSECQTPTTVNCLVCGSKVGRQQKNCKSCSAALICATKGCGARLTKPGKLCQNCQLAPRTDGSSTAPVSSENPPVTPQNESESPEANARNLFVNWFKENTDFARRIDLTVKDDDPRRFTIRPGTRALVYIASEHADLLGQTSLDFFEIGGKYSDTREITARMLMNRTGVGFRSGMPPVSILLLDAGRLTIRIEQLVRTNDSDVVTLALDVSLEIASAKAVLDFMGKQLCITKDDMGKTIEKFVKPIVEPVVSEVDFEYLRTVDNRITLCTKILSYAESRIRTIGFNVVDIFIESVTPSANRVQYQRSMEQVRKRALDRSVLESTIAEHVKLGQVIVAERSEQLVHWKQTHALEIESLTLDLDKELQINAVRISSDTSRARLEAIEEDNRKVRESLETGKLRSDAEELVARVDIETRRRTLHAIVRGLDTDDKISDFKDERRFADYVRETERNLKLDAVMSDAEISELHRTIGNKQRYAQFVDDIALRNNIRKQELDEAQHQIDLLAPARDAKLSDAGLRQQLQVIDIAMQLETASLGRSIREADSFLADVQARRDLELSKLREQLDRDRIEFLQGIGERNDLHDQNMATIESERERASKEHDAKIAIMLNEQVRDRDYQILQTQLSSQAEQLRIYATMSPEQLAIATGQPVEAIIAVTATRNSSTDDSQYQKMMMEFYRMAAEKADADKQLEIARANEAHIREIHIHKEYFATIVGAQTAALEAMKAVGVAAAGAGSGGSTQRIEVNPPQPVPASEIHVHLDTNKGN